jgi:hypothetical protein
MEMISGRDFTDGGVLKMGRRALGIPGWRFAATVV